MLLHIILTILKILGILILILLALILLTLFSLLFVPVTYRIRGRREKNDEQKEILEGSAVVCWLFGLLRSEATMQRPIPQPEFPGGRKRTSGQRTTPENKTKKKIPVRASHLVLYCAFSERFYTA